jgi:hypothetical protein
MREQSWTYEERPLPMHEAIREAGSRMPELCDSCGTYSMFDVGDFRACSWCDVERGRAWQPRGTVEK